MAAVETLLFDMDGVFCAYDFPTRLNHLEDVTGVPAAEIEARIFKSGFEDGADLGHYGADGYIKEIARLLDTDMDRNTWLAARAASMTPWPEMAQLARDLKGRHPIAMLSNNGWLLREAIGGIMPELPEVFGERLFFSAELGGGKETPATFTTLLAVLGWQPATTLFIDDSETYIASAAEAGLQTFTFSDVAGFRAELLERGLI